MERIIVKMISVFNVQILTWNFNLQIEILVKFEFLSRIKILVKKRNFGQKTKFWSKN